jgi:tetratricopeptide (TPR) repeat protein
MVAPNTAKLTGPSPEARWTLSFASGYLDLGMLEKAEKEFAKLPPEEHHRPEALALAGRVLMARQKWEEALKLFAIGRVLYPDTSDFYVQAAIAYEMTERVLESKKMWELVPRPIRQSGLAHFNLARCEAKLGNLRAAKRHLAKAVMLDPQFQTVLGQEPGLVQLLKPADTDN